LEGVEAGEVEELGELVEGAAGFIEEVGVGEVFGVEVFAVVAGDPILQVVVEFLGEEDGLVEGGLLVGGEFGAEAETGGAAAVAHGLADVDVEDLLDLGGLFADEVDGGGGGGELGAFGGGE
jgi:hypothetical protein